MVVGIRLISKGEMPFHKKEEGTMVIFSNIHGRPSNILNMGSPKGRSLRWSFRQAFGSKGIQLYRGLNRDIKRYRKLLFQEEFYRSHAEKFILFRAGKVVAGDKDFDNLVVSFLPKAESGYYLICNMSRLAGQSLPPYHPVPWIHIEPDDNLSEEEIEELLRKNSRWHWKRL